MIARPLATVAAVSLVGCSPAPRSTDYFEAHPDIARSMQAQCAAGRKRGDDCANAALGASRAAAAARQAGYRRGF